jgi:hypothetical protein
VRPSIEDLKTLWLHAYSRSAFDEAIEYLDLLPKVPAGVMARVLISAAVVAYARPFSACRVTSTEKVVPLRGVKPPDDLAENHQDAIDLRNKLIGHKDAVPAERHTTSPNIVLIHKLPTYFEVHTTTIDSMDQSAQLALKKLCVFFKQHCESIISPITKRYFAEVMKNPDGIYELIISEPPSDWIKPFQPKASAA